MIKLQKITQVMEAAYGTQAKLKSNILKGGVYKQLNQSSDTFFIQMHLTRAGHILLDKQDPINALRAFNLSKHLINKELSLSLPNKNSDFYLNQLTAVKDLRTFAKQEIMRLFQPTNQ